MTNTPGKEFVFDEEFDQNINRIVCNDINFLEVNIEAKLKLFWLNSNIDSINYNSK